MPGRNNRIVLIAIPIALTLAVASLFARLFSKKKEVIPEEVKIMARNAVKDIEITVMKLKEALENKSAYQLEKNIDNAVEIAKSSIDKVASQIKVQLKNTI